MAPKKVVNQTEARHDNELAMKQQVAIPDIISDLKQSNEWSPNVVEGLDRYLQKYEKGSLKATAVAQLLRTLVGMDKVKESIERLVPGYTRAWSPSPFEHPLIV